MKVAIGADHRGFDLKESIKKNFTTMEISWIDVGSNSTERSDYPDFAKLVAKEIQHGQADVGILLCGTGIGMSIVANRFKGIYAGLAWNKTVAKLNKEHDNVNLLVLPADFISEQQAIEMISVWFKAQFLGGRYQDRIEKIDALNGI